MNAKTETVLFSVTALLLAAVTLAGLTGFAFPTAASPADQQVLHAYGNAACPATAEASAVRADRRG